AALEAHLDRRLVQRTTRAMALTPAGRAFHRRIGPLLDELDRATALVGESETTPRGLLRVACPLVFAHEHLTRWLVALGQDHPELTFDLVLDYARNDLIEDHIDVAIRFGVLEPSSLVATKLAPMPRAVVASPDYVARHGQPTLPDEIARSSGHRAAVFPYDGHGGRWRFRDAKGRGTRVEVDVRYRVTDGLVLRQLARAAMAVTLLPRWLILEDLRRGTLVDLFPGHDVTSTEHDGAIWLVYPSRTYLPLRVRVFIDHVKKQCNAAGWSCLHRPS
ncbi:MAG: LysR family transcriptional regulator, partial [Myxococcota bacterium]